MPQLIVGVMHMAYQANGWSEKHYFLDSINDQVAAIPLMKQIIWGRSAFFGSGVSCIYARVSKIGPGPDKETIPMPYPVGPHPTWSGGGGPGDVNEAPNDPDVCVQQVMQAVGSKWNNRYFRGLPDSWVKDKVLAAGILPYFQPAAATGSTPDMSPGGPINSHLGICQAFWRFLLINTVLTKKVTAINFSTSQFRDVIFRQVTDKKTGRPFGVSRGRRPSTLTS